MCIRDSLFAHGLRRLNEDRINAKLLEVAVHYAALLEQSGGLRHQSQLLIEDRLPETAHTRDPALFLYHAVVYESAGRVFHEDSAATQRGFLAARRAHYVALGLLYLNIPYPPVNCSFLELLG